MSSGDGLAGCCGSGWSSRWDASPSTRPRGSLQDRALAASPGPVCKGGTVPAHGQARTLGTDGLCCLVAVHPGRRTCQHLCLGHLGTMFPVAWNLLAGSAEHRAVSHARLEERQLPGFTLGMPLRKNQPLLQPWLPCCSSAMYRGRCELPPLCPALPSPLCQAPPVTARQPLRRQCCSDRSVTRTGRCGRQVSSRGGRREIFPIQHRCAGGRQAPGALACTGLSEAPAGAPAL